MNEEVNKEILISQVFSKQLIWDKRLKKHSNRKAVDNAWQEISIEMGVQDDVLRKKWKYLRDQFAHELGRIHIARLSHSANKNIESQWAYFNSLLFLSGIIKPRTSLANLTRKKKTQLEPDPEPESNKYEVELADNEEASNQSTEEVEEDVAFEETNNDYQDMGSSFLRSDEATTSSFKFSHCEHSQRKRRRNDSDRNYNQKIISLEEKKARLLELEEIINEKSRKENEDLFFFRSLLPHVEKIPDNIKLRFRSRVQQLVEEFAYPQISPPILNPVFNSVTQSNNSMPPAYSIHTLPTTRLDENVEDIQLDIIKNEF